ncbi:MAG: hypothetical protein SF053_20305 [Bacteroidia bacterium]|nr:hypothetical protein [Bacteroidia bacterium]
MKTTLLPPLDAASLRENLCHLADSHVFSVIEYEDEFRTGHTIRGYIKGILTTAQGDAADISTGDPVLLTRIVSLNSQYTTAYQHLAGFDYRCDC